MNGAKNAGVVPMEPTEDEIPKGEWGKLHLVGAIEGKQGRIVMGVVGVECSGL